LDEYLSKVPIPDDDPGLLFCWDLTALDAFVNHANKARANRKTPSHPAWLATFSPNITKSTLTNDIVAHLAPHAGGRCANVMLAPNSVIQYGNVLNVLARIEVDPFIQHCMQQLPAGVFLANTYVINDREVSCAKPTQRAAPDAPYRQVFQ
jgi:hypothetical protein